MTGTKDESYYRQKAADCLRKEQESFERSDTDGCVSQWCHSLSAREASARADILRDGGMAVFTGLYEGERRVRAKRIDTQYGTSWLLDATESDLIRRRGKKFLPTGKSSRVLKSLGLSERPERAPAWAVLGGGGTGFSGLTSVYVRTYRTGCEWGSDATPLPEDDAPATERATPKSKPPVEPIPSDPVSIEIRRMSATEPCIIKGCILEHGHDEKHEFIF